MTTRGKPLLKSPKVITSAACNLANLLVERGYLHPSLKADVNQILLAAWLALKDTGPDK
jgi:hypothetical protein